MKSFFKMNDVIQIPLDAPEEEVLTFAELAPRLYQQELNKFLVAERANSREEGFKKGFEKGREMAKREVGLNMTKIGFPVDQIAYFVNSDEDFVKSLQAEIE